MQLWVSCGFAAVVIQHSAESLAFPQLSGGLHGSFGCHDQAIVESLVVSFHVVMRYEFSDRVSQRIFAKQNHLF